MSCPKALIVLVTLLIWFAPSPARETPGVSSESRAAGAATEPHAAEESAVAEPSNTRPCPVSVFQFVVQNREYDWTDWARESYWALFSSTLQALLQSLEAHSREDAENEPFYPIARIEFVVNRKGRTSGARLTSPFAHKILDEAALQAAREAKLPPLPADFPEKRVAISASLRLTGQIDAAALQQLRTMRDAGLFRGSGRVDDWCEPTAP